MPRFESRRSRDGSSGRIILRRKRFGSWTVTPQGAIRVAAHVAAIASSRATPRPRPCVTPSLFCASALPHGFAVPHGPLHRVMRHEESSRMCFTIAPYAQYDAKGKRS